jgi:plasmid stabilization system protein ParE
MTERYSVKVMPEASGDLTGIFEYIEPQSPQNALSVIVTLFGSIDSLSQLPHRCKVHRSHRNPARVAYDRQSDADRRSCRAAGAAQNGS